MSQYIVDGKALWAGARALKRLAETEETKSGVARLLELTQMLTPVARGGQAVPVPEFREPPTVLPCQGQTEPAMPEPDADWPESPDDPELELGRKY